MLYQVLSLFVLGCLSAPVPDDSSEEKIEVVQPTVTAYSHPFYHAAAPAFYHAASPYVFSGANSFFPYSPFRVVQAGTAGVTTTYDASSPANQAALDIAQEAVKISQDVVGNPTVLKTAPFFGATPYHASFFPSWYAHRSSFASPLFNNYWGASPVLVGDSSEEVEYKPFEYKPFEYKPSEYKAFEYKPFEVVKADTVPAISLIHGSSEEK